MSFISKMIDWEMNLFNKPDSANRKINYQLSNAAEWMTSDVVQCPQKRYELSWSCIRDALELSRKNQSPVGQYWTRTKCLLIMTYNYSKRYALC